MTVAVNKTPGLASRLVNGVLSIKPLAALAKHQAREMMINRAEKIGVHWREEAQALLERNWDAELLSVQNPDLVYPKYYLTSFHAYEKGNMSWEAATEVEVAARAVHAGIWPEAGAEGDAKLRASYHEIVKAQISQTPQDIVDLGCSVGMSTFALGDVYPEAKMTGVDLSPYFLSVAQYRSQQREAEFSNQKSPIWVHAAAESTGLPAASFDLVSICLVCHELPEKASKAVFREARRLLRAGGHLTIMDMNPRSEVYAKMPPYILTLLKSTEPYLDQYFGLNIEQALVDSGFAAPTITCNTLRHRTIVAEAI
ncbi:MAG: methyltransferase domain-containing protein [Microcoleus sp. PH2017_10_PVI_O_A]|uniref:class I SAM-dependent methyltransferase n=1 Tax=unclassified Microcoleus TaxID=2642155 RepID=UPI001D89F2D0|nr:MULTISPECIES: class I SAM-dependent methyltransferase [unclassified Microcoleus]TAE78780.1 MAG: methyltransferase domain-containing protein [Oscillatoriales cyanobacterium]MCC3408687.1 methyltransferase domain-containing protein [Microcoleus sp. PH2017_10_PVI_O_A]MCC3462764.1 methyltransferase domain-containing protein [Microcoleus sp. PH2017_11_PCY_U_A]MCC3481226.1 methyltransferase domain-containing protein [Microcoleus sp. PH2017_12_PCY_D_A]MCC3531248.1 methyltransferase domain-containin